MLDFDRLQRTPRFSRPRRPPMRVFYQPPRPVVRRPRFHNPRRPVHYSPKIEAPKQFFVVQRHVPRHQNRPFVDRRTQQQTNSQRVRVLKTIRRVTGKSPFVTRGLAKKRNTPMNFKKPNKQNVSPAQLDKELNKYYESDANVMKQRMDSDLETYYAKSNVQTEQPGNPEQQPVYQNPEATQQPPM